MPERWIVLTTINPPTEAVQAIAQLCTQGWSAVVVGDERTPGGWHVPGIDYLSVSRQRELFGAFADHLPFNHYCRKNLGYLYAMTQGATCILETDDDNIPLGTFGRDVSERRHVRLVQGSEWINIYKHFTDAFIWPRGLPIDEIDSVGEIAEGLTEQSCPVQQYLADGDPDVDAIYRRVVNQPVTFEQRLPIALMPGVWSPFNSQNTLFYTDAFLLLYLPCLVSFRMTDIWRSLVAQQCLWLKGLSLCVMPATVRQVRNSHDLLRDFADEVPGHCYNRRIARTLSEKARTLNGMEDMATICRALWGSLLADGIIERAECDLLDEWLDIAARVLSDTTRA